MPKKPDLSRFLQKNRQPEQEPRKPPRVPPPSCKVAAKALKAQPDLQLDAPASLPHGSRTGPPPIPGSQEEDSEQPSLEQRVTSLVAANQMLMKEHFDLVRRVEVLLEEGAPITAEDIIEMEPETTHDPNGGGMWDRKKIRGTPTVQATTKTISPDIMEAIFAVAEASAKEAEERINRIIDARFKAIAKVFVNLLAQNRERVVEKLKQEQRKAEAGGNE